MKNYLTKSQFNIFYILMPVVVLLSSCTKERIVEDDSEGGVTREDPTETPVSFDAENNEKGQSTLFIDVREFKKNGVSGEKAVLRFENSELSSHDVTLDINQFLDVAQFLKENVDIQNDGLSLFDQGLVEAKIEILDEGNQKIAEKEFDLLTSGSRLVFNKEDLISPPEPNTNFVVEFGIPYFMQSKVTGELLSVPDGTVGSAGVETRPSMLSDQNVKYQEVVFWPVPWAQDEVYIQFLHSSNFTTFASGNDPVTNEEITYLYQSDSTDSFDFENGNPMGCNSRYLFLKEGAYIKFLETCGFQFYLTAHNNYEDHKFLMLKDLDYATNPDQYLFRLVPSDLIYEVEDDGHNFGSFAFSKGNIDVAYAQSILNCSKATLTETVGQSETRESTRELATEESFEVYSEQSSSFGVTAGVSAGFSAFGAEVNASLEVSTDHSFTSSSTTTNSKFFGFSDTVTTEVSREREIEVPPGAKLSVFDAVSTVEAVPIDFVHRYTIKAQSESTGNYVSGRALRSALESSGFGGVVLEEGSNFLKLSLRGTYHVDKLITTKTELMDLGECD